MPTTATAAEATTASTESAESGMTHAGEAVITAHLGFTAAANTAECTAITAGVLAFKTLGTETLLGLGSSRLSCAAECFRTTTGCSRIASETRGRATKTAGHCSISIGDT